MIMSTVAAALTPAAIPTVRCHPLSDLPLDVGCTCDNVTVCTGVVVQDICVDAIVAVDVLEVVDIFEAVARCF